MATVSVITVLWNAEPTLARCLAALGQSTVDLDVTCVDNASHDGGPAVARASGARVIEMGRNAGFPAAVNAALPTCTADHVLLVNPDVEVEPDTIERCLEALRDHTVGLVGANLVRPDGTPDLPAARRFRRLSLLAIETLGLPRVHRRFDLQYLSCSERRQDRDVDAINGAFMLLRREVLVGLGGLDDSVFMFLEDQELCRRVRDLGLRVRFVASARAIHVAGAATGAARPDQKAVIYLHRMDASIELIRRLQGAQARRVAIGLWTLRCLLGSVVRGTRSRRERDRYRGGLRWLRQQWGDRTPPPPVP
jgi:GT2 family glycosyltransferase